MLVHNALKITLVIVVLLSAAVQAQVQDGYIIVSSMMGRSTSLIDINKREVHRWTHTATGGYSVHLTEKGTIIRACTPSGVSGISGAASSGRIEEIDKDGNVLWSFTHKSNQYVLHHDVEPMPNGNVLAIAWEVKSAQEASEKGFTSNRGIWPDKIIEVAPPSGTEPARIVWEWHAWDHLVPADQASNHPELLSVGLGSSSGGFMPGMGGGDWMHMNGLSYNDSLDLITFSSHYFNEIYIIDHGTTTEEAAGHTGGRRGKGGDLLYRWGAPRNYGGTAPNVFDVVHCAVWVPYGYPGGGHVMALNNKASSRTASIFTELDLPMDAAGNFTMNSGVFGPSEPFWTYESQGFYSQGQGSLQRLPNGNTIMATNDGDIREVTNSGEIVWEYSSTGLAQIQKYPQDHPGVRIVLGLDPVQVRTELPPNHTQGSISYASGAIGITGMNGATMHLYSLDGKEIVRTRIITHAYTFTSPNLVNGIYLVCVKDRNSTLKKTINVF